MTDSSTALSNYILPLLEESTGVIWVHETNAKFTQQSLEFAMARQSVMKRLSSYEPFNKMADAVLYGGVVALIFGSMRSFNKLEVPAVLKHFEKQLNLSKLLYILFMKASPWQVHGKTKDVFIGGFVRLALGTALQTRRIKVRITRERTLVTRPIASTQRRTLCSSCATTVRTIALLAALTFCSFEEFWRFEKFWSQKKPTFLSNSLP